MCVCSQDQSDILNFGLQHIYIFYYMVGWLFEFYGISTFVGYSNPFLYK